MNALSLKTTLLLIPGGRELSLPQNANTFKKALTEALANNTIDIIMLADKALIPEEEVQMRYKYKNVLLIESDTIHSKEDAFHEVSKTLEGHLPALHTAGFDYQVVKMEFIQVKYEDIERLSKFVEDDI
ncbi:MAG: hypothetical protein V4581_07490 [Bacteroidota bacterium]